MKRIYKKLMKIYTKNLEKIESKKKKNTNGITLVALIITIVILLILAGVAISQLTQTGFFEKVKLAKQKHENAQLKEENTLNEYENKIDEINGVSKDKNTKSDINIIKIGEYDSSNTQEINIKSILPQQYKELKTSNFVMLNSSIACKGGSEVDEINNIIGNYDAEKGILKINRSWVRAGGFNMYVSFTLGCIMGNVTIENEISEDNKSISTDINIIKIGEYDSSNAQEINIKSILPQQYKELKTSNFVMLNSSIACKGGSEVDEINNIIGDYDAENGILKINRSWVRADGFNMYVSFTLGCIVGDITITLIE